MIQNDMFSQKTSSNSMEKVLCSSSNYVVLKHFHVNLMEFLRKSIVNINLGQVSMIPNDMFFQRN